MVGLKDIATNGDATRSLARGALALAAGSFALPGMAQAAIIVNNTSQSPSDATLSFGGVTQFTVAAPLGTRITAQVAGNLIYGTESRATKLGAGTTIGPSTFATGPSASSTGLAYPKGGTKYVGLDVHTATGTENYGFLQYDMSGIRGYAFEDIPNTAITTFDVTAVDPTPVPEPASLALLAAGLAGAGAIRRRHAATAQASFRQ